MAVPIKFIAKRSLKRIQKGKPVSPFQFGRGRKNKKTPIQEVQVIQDPPKKDLKPLFFLGGIILVAYLLNKK